MRKLPTLAVVFALLAVSAGLKADRVYALSAGLKAGTTYVISPGATYVVPGFSRAGFVVPGFPPSQQAAAPQGGQQRLTDAQRKSASLEVPRLIELLGLKTGAAVADVGAGFGAWTMEFSQAVGPSGRVYATEIGANQLTALRETVAQRNLANVTVLEGAERSTNLPPLCCDAILIRDAYHHLTQPADIARSLAAALRPGGRLAVIDFPPRPSSAVPSGVPANRGGHGVPPEVVTGELTAAGLTAVSTQLTWSPGSEPGDLYLLVFRKP